MKLSSRNFTFLIVAGVVLSIASCCRGFTYFVFTADELTYLPYDTISVPEYFKDENGLIYPLQLVERKFSHTDQSTDPDCQRYDNVGFARLTLDTVDVLFQINKFKRSSSFYVNPADPFWWNVTVDDAVIEEVHDGLLLYPDSLMIGTQTFHNVYRWEADTSVIANAGCWRLYFNTDRGLLRADFRNGHYYEIQ